MAALRPTLPQVLFVFNALFPNVLFKFQPVSTKTKIKCKEGLQVRVFIRVLLENIPFETKFQAHCNGTGLKFGHSAYFI